VTAFFIAILFALAVALCFGPEVAEQNRKSKGDK
jgi:hypothetical protein